VCRKCGEVRTFGTYRFDPINATATMQAPPLDARTKALLFLRGHDGVRVDWSEFRKAVGVSHLELGRVVRELLAKGVIIEAQQMTYFVQNSSAEVEEPAVVTP
jgi:hypothetical protein